MQHIINFGLLKGFLSVYKETEDGFFTKRLRLNRPYIFYLHILICALRTLAVIFIGAVGAQVLMAF